MRAVRTVVTWAILLAVAPMSAATGAPLAPPGDAAANAKILAWCQANTAQYTDVIAQAKTSRAHKPEVPVPPELMWPCHACDTPPGQKSAAELQADTFAKQSLQPEHDQVLFLFGVRQEMDAIADQGVLWNSSVRQCMRAFDRYRRDTDDAIPVLLGRIWAYKAYDMFQAYQREVKRAYAGIEFLNQASHFVGTADAHLTPPSTFNDQQKNDWVMTWLSRAIAQADKDVFDRRAYDLCPSYLNLYRQIELEGGVPADMTSVEKEIQKMEDFLHFNVTMDLAGSAHGSNGGHFDVSWHGETTLRLKLKGGCYTPELEPDSNLHVTVNRYTVVGTSGSAEFVGPRQFDLPIESVAVTLCDAQPQLALHFRTFGPTETIRVKGIEVPSGVLSGVFAGALNADLIRGGAGAAKANASQELERAKAALAAHKGDAAWFLSQEGQAAIRQMQSQALGAASGSPTSAGLGLQGGDIAHTLTVPWTNGVSEVVSAQRAAHTGQLDSAVLKISVQQRSGQ